MPTATRRTPSRTARRQAARRIADTFTDRQIEVLQAFVDHAGSQGAAIALHLDETTVRGTLETMRSKAGLLTTYQLTLLAAHRLTPPHGPNGPLQKQG